VSLLQANPVNDPLLVIPAIYDDVHPFSDGVAEVQRDGKWETIDRNGQRVSADKLENHKPDGSAKTAQKTRIHTDSHTVLKYIRRNGKTGIEDQHGNVLVPPIYGFIGQFSEGMAPVSDFTHVDAMWGYVGGKWGFINANGKLVIPLKYYGVGDFHDGLAAVIIDHGLIDRRVLKGRWAPIDKRGKLVIGTKYDRFQHLTGSLLAVCSGSRKDEIGIPSIGGKWGVFDYHTKRLVVPIKYDRLNGLSDRLFAVCVGEKYLPPKDRYDYTDLGTVIDPGKWGVIDYHGKTILPLIYAGTRELSQGMLAVKLNGKWGFVRLK